MPSLRQAQPLMYTLIGAFCFAYPFVQGQWEPRTVCAFWLAALVSFLTAAYFTLCFASLSRRGGALNQGIIRSLRRRRKLAAALTTPHHNASRASTADTVAPLTVVPNTPSDAPQIQINRRGQ